MKPAYNRSKIMRNADFLDGEIWSPVKGLEDLYMVSNMGRVYSLPRYKLVIIPVVSGAVSACRRQEAHKSATRGCRVGDKGNTSRHVRFSSLPKRPTVLPAVAPATLPANPPTRPAVWFTLRP